MAVVAGDVDAGLGELLLDVGVRHEDDVAAVDERAAHLVDILHGGRIQTESEGAESRHSHGVTLGGPCGDDCSDGAPGSVDHLLGESAAHGSFLDNLTLGKLTVEVCLHNVCPLLLTLLKSDVALDSFYFDTHNSNSFLSE